MRGRRDVIGSLVRRLRWDVSGEAAVNSRDPATMARTFVYLYGSGGALVLLTLALPHAADRWDPGLIVPGVCALLVAVAVAVAYDRVPIWVFVALPPLGAGLVSVVLYSAGAATITVYAGLYFWVTLAAFSFFSLRVALLNLAWCGALYGAVLGASPDAGQIVLRWVMVIGTLTVAALVIASLRGRVERLVETLRRRSLKQQKVAELGERAVAGASIPDLLELASQALTEALQVEYAAVLRSLPHGEGVLLVAGEGWPPELLGGATLPEDDALVRLALRSPEAVALADYGEQLASMPGYPETPRDLTSGIGVAIPGGKGPFGVLAAYSRETKVFEPTERSFLQSVGHVLGEAVERRRNEEQTQHQAMHDRLTGRPNRYLLMDRLQEALIRSHESGSVLALYFLDIDDFKLINDGLGHGAGDELLCAFGPRLREVLVMSDTVARFGGDEFAILCEDVEGERAASEIAMRLQEALSKPFTLGGVKQRINASIGVTLSTRSAGAEELIAEADAAMYLAKEQSRGGFEFFDHELRQRVQKRLKFEGALRAAPDSGQLDLAVQPIVSLPEGVPVASEVLLRWRHPELGSISPAEFIPVAEQTGAIIPLGEWVLREAFRLAARWRSDPVLRSYLPLYINLSARQLEQPGFTEAVEAGVNAAGARLRDLGFEITEHALLGASAGPVQALERLQALGSAISLDDFGTGYSSLSHLKRFPLDTIKIDRLFVSNLTDGHRDEAIVSAVVGMADAFALDVVAEGIETVEQATRLAELGCRFGQGFLFARPTSARELEGAPRLATPGAADPQPGSASSAARAASLDE